MLCLFLQTCLSLGGGNSLNLDDTNLAGGFYINIPAGGTKYIYLDKTFSAIVFWSFQTSSSATNLFIKNILTAPIGSSGDIDTVTTYQWNSSTKRLTLKNTHSSASMNILCIYF